MLCYFEGRTHDEAAAALDWPVGTVRCRLSRPVTCSALASLVAGWRRRSRRSGRSGPYRRHGPRSPRRYSRDARGRSRRRARRRGRRGTRGARAPGPVRGAVADGRGGHAGPGRDGRRPGLRRERRDGGHRRSRGCPDDGRGLRPGRSRRSSRCRRTPACGWRTPAFATAVRSARSCPLPTARPWSRSITIASSASGTRRRAGCGTRSALTGYRSTGSPSRPTARPWRRTRIHPASPLRLWDVATGRERRRWHLARDSVSVPRVLARRPDPDHREQSLRRGEPAIAVVRRSVGPDHAPRAPAPDPPRGTRRRGRGSLRTPGRWPPCSR